jgi:PilZ domain
MLTQSKITRRHANGPSSEERRRSPRRPCIHEAPLWPMGSEGQPARWASVQNLSHHGVGLLLSCRFPPGATLAIGLPRECGWGGQAVVGRVVHATPAPQGNWWLGCTLEGAPAAKS